MAKRYQRTKMSVAGEGGVRAGKRGLNAGADKTAGTLGATVAPPVVQEVLRSPGQPLDRETRSLFESHFGHDFSRVRVHTDSRATDSAKSVEALAYTSGQNIVFGSGQFAPQTTTGRKLLAHELTHVVQQSSHRPQASTSVLEREASQAAHAIAGGAAVDVTAGAPSNSLLFTRQKVNGKDFEFGDVVLNAKADTDVRKNGVLFPGADQAHIAVSADHKLGYEVDYKTPDDPFRWGHMKDIVDNESVDISGIDPTATFKVKEVTGATETVPDRSLLEFGGSGITLPRVSVEKAIDPNAKVYVASTDDSRDQIYYDSSGAGGRGMLGSNSLAHELFGHLWLAMKGVSWKHNTQLTAAAGVKDPQGRAYAGGVNEYISHYAGESANALESPTQGVSPSLQTATLDWISQNGASGLKRQPQNRFDVSPEFGLQWERLSGNYSIVKFQHESETQPKSTMANVVTTADGIRKWVVSWFGTLNPDQQWVFKSFLSALTKGWTAPQGRRTELATDLKSMLP